MMVGTFLGSNRQEQLVILAEIYGIPMNSDLINIEHRNGNSWFTGYFKKEEKRAYCISKIKEINKEIVNLDTTSEDNTFKVYKLEEISPRVQAKKKPSEEETTIQILDISEEFTPSRIKGALRRYRTITEIHIYSDR